MTTPESITVPVEESIPEALAKGLLGVDTARRVGWAKAFDALRLNETLSEDLRQTRDELKHLRRAYSRLLGFLDNIPIKSSSVSKAELGAHRRAEAFFRHDDAYMAGWSLAWDHKAKLCGWSPEERDEHKARWLRDEQARKAAFVAKRPVKEQLRRLWVEALDLGHYTESLPPDSQQMVLKMCKCGASSGLRTQYEATTWAREHMTQVVYGQSYVDWMRQFDDSAGSDRDGSG